MIVASEFSELPFRGCWYAIVPELPTITATKGQGGGQGLRVGHPGGVRFCLYASSRDTQVHRRDRQTSRFGLSIALYCPHAGITVGVGDVNAFSHHAANQDLLIAQERS